MFDILWPILLIVGIFALFQLVDEAADGLERLLRFLGLKAKQSAVANVSAYHHLEKGQERTSQQSTTFTPSKNLFWKGVGIGVVIGIILMLVWSGRYEITPMENGQYIKYDRWTGQTEYYHYNRRIE